MSKYNFVHLHNHTEYSLLDGMLKVGPLVERAKELGMNAVAMTDHGNMYGSIEFYQECQKQGIKPIIGSEFYMTRGSRFEKGGVRHHLVLLAKSDKGYKNLMKLSSFSFTEGFYYKPRIDRELLEKYSEDLVCLSACLQGEIPWLILNGQYAEAEETACYYRELFGKLSFFLEIQIHGIKEERTVAKEILAMSRKLQIPVVATNDAHYLNKDDAEAHEVLLCIGTKKTMSDPRRMRFHGEEFYFKSEQEMELIFKEVPKALSNTQYVAEMCELDIQLPGPILPDFEIPEGFTKETYLRKVSEEGLSKRYPEITTELNDRLDMELSTIERMGFPGYFLIVWDFIKYARDNGIWVGPGRGSGAGSIVAYALGITNIDPIRYDLIFERFLNEERVSMPDFDIDFCKERRHEVIDYVYRKYTKEKVSQIVTFSKMKAKAAIRDVGRALDIPLRRVDEIAKLIPEGKNLKKEIDETPELKEIYLHGADEERNLLDVSIRIEKISRHTSIHAAGVVIGQKEITEYVPKQMVRDKSGDSITTQFPGPQLEMCGLVKMDFLGLITLTLLRNCLELLEKKNVKIDLDGVSLDDQKAYALFSRGDTEAVFQFESPGMQKFLKKLQPTCLEDLIAMNALYRPGPMNFIDSYIDRKHGREEVVYDHELMEPILKETYGIMIYQEQVMKIAQVLAGYTLGGADILRRAMGKKKISEMEKHEKIFIDGCKEKNNIDTELAKTIFDKMAEFANYGFNKSHATAYAYLAYQCGYLKAYYPAEFMASVLTSEMNKSDKLLEYVLGLGDIGIEILPPDINHSFEVFDVEDGKIRYALSGIKGVGDTASQNIVKVREENGKYTDFYQFMQSIDLRVVNRAVIEILIKTGAFDCFGQKRKWMLENLDDALKEAQHVQADRKVGQARLFDFMEEESDETGEDSGVEGIDVEEWDIDTLLQYERDILGFYVSGHPLDPYKAFLKQICNHSSKSIKELNFEPRGEGGYIPRIPVKMAAIVGEVKVFRTEKGGEWATFLGEDFEGQFKVNIYTNEFEQFREMIEETNLLFITGDCSMGKGGGQTVIARKIEDIKEMQQKSISEFHVYMKNSEINNDSLEHFKNDLITAPGSLNVFFHLFDHDEEIIIKANNVTAPKDVEYATAFKNKYAFIDNIKIV